MVAFLAYRLTAQLLGGTSPNPFVYFDLLAGSILHGELYIRSVVRNDLTFYDGRWYVL